MSIESADAYLDLMTYGRALGLTGPNWDAVEFQFLYALDIGVEPTAALENAKGLADQIGAPMFLRRQAI